MELYGAKKYQKKSLQSLNACLYLKFLNVCENFMHVSIV